MNKINSKINIAVVGVGYWGPNLVRNFHQLDGVNIHTVCDSEEGRLGSVKRDYPGVNVAKDFNEVLGNQEIQAIAIAVPTELHYQLGKKALESGKHVLVEKPFTSNFREAEELIRIAKRKRKVLMVDHTFIYTGAVKKIKELIDKKELGNINYFDSERVNLGLIRSDANVLWDLAAHDIAIIIHLIKQKPVSLSAVGSSHVFKKKEEMAHLTIRHQNGIISHIHTSWLSPLKIRKIVVGGDKKMVLYDDVEPTEKIKIYDKGVDIKPNKITPFNPLYRSGDILIPKLDQTEALRNVCEHFVECIRKKRKPITDGEAGLKVVKILEASQKSIREGGKLIRLN